MKQSSANPALVIKLAILQITMTLVLSIGLYFFYDQRIALSAFWGGAVCALANVLFVARLLKTREVVMAELMLYQFYRSEVMKIIFTLAMFAFFIVLVKVAILPFVIAYLVAAVLLNWLFIFIADA